MNTEAAVSALAALGHPTRLALFRLLVRSGDKGMAAGVIAEAMGTPSSSISFHLSELVRAGLIERHRRSRSLIYTARFSAIRFLADFLLESCCAEHQPAASDERVVKAISPEEGRSDGGGDSGRSCAGRCPALNAGLATTAGPNAHPEPEGEEIDSSLTGLRGKRLGLTEVQAGVRPIREIVRVFRLDSTHPNSLQSVTFGAIEEAFRKRAIDLFLTWDAACNERSWSGTTEEAAGIRVHEDPFCYALVAQDDDVATREGVSIHTLAQRRCFPFAAPGGRLSHDLSESLEKAGVTRRRGFADLDGTFGGGGDAWLLAPRSVGRHPPAAYAGVGLTDFSVPSVLYLALTRNLFDSERYATMMLAGALGNALRR